MLTRSFLTLALTGLLIATFLPFVANAALLPDCDPVPGTGSLPGRQGQHDCGTKDILQLLVNIYNFMLGMAALVTMLMLVYGGVRMLIFQYYEDAPGELKNAKFTVTRAMFGLVIVLTAYLLVNTLIAFLGGGDINTIFSRSGFFR